MTANDVSTAVTMYLGYGSSAFPLTDYARLVSNFGDARAVELKSQIKSLLQELDSSPIDWSSHSLQSAGDLVRSSTRARHPELTDEAVQALVWKFTFDWR